MIAAARLPSGHNIILVQCAFNKPHPWDITSVTPAAFILLEKEINSHSSGTILIFICYEKIISDPHFSA